MNFYRLLTLAKINPLRPLYHYTAPIPLYQAHTIRRALEFIPQDRLIITADCGFGREGLSRRIAFYKCVSLLMGANIVRRKLGIDSAYVAVADERYAY